MKKREIGASIVVIDDGAIHAAATKKRHATVALSKVRPPQAVGTATFSTATKKMAWRLMSQTKAK